MLNQASHWQCQPSCSGIRGAIDGLHMGTGDPRVLARWGGGEQERHLVGNALCWGGDCNSVACVECREQAIVFRGEYQGERISHKHAGDG